jgi:SRSO17 transposase
MIWWCEDQPSDSGRRPQRRRRPARWQELLDELLGRVAGRFARADLRRRARAFVRGLLADLPRMNCWTIAEHAGDPNPDGMQHLLGRAVWDHDKLRDDVRDYVIDHLDDPGAVLVVDETGDLKKGTATVGVQRQYTGTAGRVENAQVAVYLVYASSRGHAVIDRELYLPRSWTDNPEHLQAAGVPAQIGFATKPALATAMLCRALDAGVPAGWVAGDEVYGANPGLRVALEARQIGYVLAVGCDHRVRAGATSQRADALLRRLPARAWQQVSCGTGAKGHRLYDWAFVRVDHDGAAPHGQASKHWLMVRRNQRTGELAFYRCFTPRPTRWPSWSGSQDAAGRWRSDFRPARAFVAWTSTRSAAGGPGTAGPPWPCSPTPSWRWRP